MKNTIPVCEWKAKWVLVFFVFLSACNTLPTRLRTDFVMGDRILLHQKTEARLPTEIKSDTTGEVYSLELETIKVWGEGDEFFTATYKGKSKDGAPIALLLKVECYWSGRDILPEFDAVVRGYKKDYIAAKPIGRRDILANVGPSTVGGMRARFEHSDRTLSAITNRTDKTFLADVYLFRFKKYYFKIQATALESSGDQLEHAMTTVESLVKENYVPLE